jgi:hypothetical protein
MTIAFFTESGFSGKYPRNFQNARVDVAWQIALDAVHLPLNGEYHGSFDLGIVIIPKKNPDVDIDRIKSVCKRVAVMQEGPNWYWQDYKVVDQFKYLETLDMCDMILVHNRSDVPYYSGITGNKNVHVMPSVMIESGIDPKKIARPHTRSSVMIGGNFVSWYGGMDSYIVASSHDGIYDIYAPSMGRKQSDEDFTGIRYHDYQIWTDWISSLSNRKYAVHMMRTHAAGTFAMNCAYLGIPCVGYDGLDTQMICHPTLTVPLGDISEAIRHFKFLQSEPEFYKHCSEYSKWMYQEEFSERAFLKKVKYLYE